MKLTAEQLATWKRDGIIVVPNVFSPEAFVPALEEIERNAYDGLTHAEYRANWGPQPEALKSAYEKNSDMQRLAGPFGKATHFPTGLDAVDKLIENEAYLGIAQQLLGTEEIRLGYGQIFFREGLTDSRHSEHPWQGYHIDNATNSPLPPHLDWQRYGYILTAIFPHDIELDGAPMLVCPGSQNQLDKIWAKYRAEGAEWVFLIYGNLKENSRIRFPLRRKRGVFHSVPVTWFTPHNRLRTKADNAGGWGITSIGQTMTIGAKRRARCRVGVAQTT